MHLILFLKPTKQEEVRLEQPKKGKSKTKQKERTLKNTKIQIKTLNMKSKEVGIEKLGCLPTSTLI